MPVNPWLEERLAQHGGSVISVILEVPTSKESSAISAISSLKPSAPTPELAGVGTVLSISHIAGTSFITTKIDSSQIGTLSAIGNVSYNMPRSVGLVPCFFCEQKQTMTASSPTQDELLGMVGVSRVTVPTSRLTIAQDITKTTPEDYIFVPTGTLVSAIRDTPVSQALRGLGVPVAIIDTGFLPTLSHPQINLRPDFIYSLIDEPPIDQHGHGSWVSFAVTGSPFPHPTYGVVQGVADLSLPFHLKALNKDGLGDDSTILKAMEMATNLGAKVVSMSIGGEAQGGVDDDPSSKAMSALADKGMIFVVAAGNQGVPYTINSPGMCPRAITVGSLSYTDKDVSWFSSQGPQSAWYSSHPDDYDRDHAKYGDDLIKPDVMAVGGGRSSKAPIGAKDEVLFNGSVGWFSSYYTKVVDGFGAMHGSSQSTPQVAGLATCLVGAGIVNNASGFKKMLAKGKPTKSTISGYGEAKFSRFIG